MSNTFKILVLLILMALASVTGKFWLAGMLRLAGVSELEYQLEAASWQHVTLRELQLNYQNESATAALDLTGLQVEWIWGGWLPQLTRVQVNTLALTLGEKPAAKKQQTSKWTLPAQWQLPGWLPTTIQLGKLEVNYPCGDQPACQFNGRLELSRRENRVELLASGRSVPAWPGQRYTVALNYQLDNGKLLGSATMVAPLLPDRLIAMGLDITAFNIIVDGATVATEAGLSLPLHMSLTTTGKSVLQLTGDLLLFPDTGQIQIQQGAMDFTQANLQPIDSALVKNLMLSGTFKGTASAKAVDLEVDIKAKTSSACLANNCLQQAALTAGPASITLSADTNSWSFSQHQATLAGELHLAGFAANDMQLTLTDLTAVSDQGDLQFAVATELVLPKFIAPGLKPLPWRWQGQWLGDAEQQSGKGSIDHEGGLALDYSLALMAGSLTLNWQLQDIFLRAGNPLAATASDWPELASFSSGRITAHGKAALNLDRPAKVSAEAMINLHDIDGIYDTTAIKGLQATAKLNLQNESLQVSTTDLRIDQLNPGMALGPLSLQAGYEALVTSPGTGMVNWQALQLQAFGGQISLTPGSWQLGEDMENTITVAGLQLDRLLEQYPTSAIKGTGTLGGSLPVRYGSKGFSVHEGLLAASAPGGVLHYVSPDAASLAASNQGMDLLVKTLADFHYDVLSATVSYDESGQLLLALRLQGNNPAVEDGRMINFNINLEENLPALFTSLQLSDKVSDFVRQRVEQRVRQKEFKTP